MTTVCQCSVKSDYFRHYYFLHFYMLTELGHSLQSFKRKIQALKMGCYRTILGISYLSHVSKEQVRNTIQQHIGPHDDLLT